MAFKAIEPKVVFTMRSIALLCHLGMNTKTQGELMKKAIAYLRFDHVKKEYMDAFIKVFKDSAEQELDMKIIACIIENKYEPHCRVKYLIERIKQYDYLRVSAIITFEMDMISTNSQERNDLIRYLNSVGKSVVALCDGNLTERYDRELTFMDRVAKVMDEKNQ